MAQEIREFAVTVPAGTAQNAPLTVSIAFPDRVVESITGKVPPGPSGVMGWQLTSAGAPVIPIQQKTYVVTDNQTATWPLEGYLDSGNWAVTAYNTGVYPHTIYFTFLLGLIGAGVAQPVPASQDVTGALGLGGTVAPVSPSAPPPPTVTPPDPGAAAAVTAVVLAAAQAQLMSATG